MDRSHHHSHPTRPSKGSRAALVGAQGARTSSKPAHTPRPRSLWSGPVRGTGQGDSLQPSPHPPLLQWGAGSPTGPKSAGGDSGAWGKLGGLEASRERVPSRRLRPVCREHPSICRELRTPRGIRAIGGQHDVRDGAWQELAPPHLSPPIRTTLGQHKFFHVHLQHLFIISTKPQDITASDTLESFQELETEEGFPPAAIPRQRREGFVVQAADGGAGDLAQPRCRGGRGHGGTRAASTGHCPAKTTTSACPGRTQPQFHPHPSTGLMPTSLPCSVSTGSYTNSFSPSPPCFSSLQIKW